MSSQATAVSSTTAHVVRNDPIAARQLPAPDETFRQEDLPDEAADALWRFVSNDLVVRVRFDRERNHWLWRTRPAVYDHIQQATRGVTTAPCGHTGVRNLGDGDYSCTRDECDERFDRATAMEVLGG